FFIEQSLSDRPDRTLPDGRAWEYDYRLRPKSPSVKAVPNFRFDFFKPGFVPPEKGYQTTWAYAVPVRVKPRGAAVPPAPAEGPRAPETFYELATGPAVLRHEAFWGV